ncbi:peptidylprolyl isomerase [Alsobacter soli]|uniref:Parvulin-like PPIase n=1 Tax=Alsobacter soli TaxID=2109933 RepID=A0A2T1HWN1_9HYPH|nr:peptidylprolyl isomerase [Alsobacter soli]PSC06000.1 peptidylprolyl isomerase [Alsobacter soli]
MSCSVQTVSPSRKVVSVNGKVIPRAAIARESQHHPSAKPVEAWQAAARALVVRELLLQEADRLAVEAVPLTDEEGRRETDEEARMRALVEREVRTPEPDEETCQRFYESNRARFRSGDLFEVRHILFAARPDDPAASAQALGGAESAHRALLERPASFEQLAREVSDCPSAGVGGSLGQIGPGQTAPEFDRAIAALRPGEVSAPVRTRYGYHIIRVDRRIEGQVLPFEAVRSRIAAYLAEAVARRALSQFVGILAGRAEIEGFDLAVARGPLLQ